MTKSAIYCWWGYWYLRYLYHWWGWGYLWLMEMLSSVDGGYYLSVAFLIFSLLLWLNFQAQCYGEAGRSNILCNSLIIRFELVLASSKPDVSFYGFLNQVNNADFPPRYHFTVLLVSNCTHIKNEVMWNHSHDSDHSAWRQLFLASNIPSVIRLLWKVVNIAWFMFLLCHSWDSTRFQWWLIWSYALQYETGVYVSLNVKEVGCGSSYRTDPNGKSTV